MNSLKIRQGERTRPFRLLEASAMKRLLVATALAACCWTGNAKADCEKHYVENVTTGGMIVLDDNSVWEPDDTYTPIGWEMDDVLVCDTKDRYYDKRIINQSNTREKGKSVLANERSEGISNVSFEAGPFRKAVLQR